MNVGTLRNVYIAQLSPIHSLKQGSPLHLSSTETKQKDRNMRKPERQNNKRNLDARPGAPSAGQDPGPGAKDRPGFDLGGSVSDKTAGTGLGLGENAAEDPISRRLPGRRQGK